MANINAARAISHLLTFCLLLTPLSSILADTPIIQETEQRFHPVQAASGMVAAQEAIAAQVGLDILKKGGNAVDAAVAVGFALAVTLPRAGGLGGGGFMLIWLNKQHKAVAINYREKAPMAATKTLFVNKDGEIDKDKLLGSYFSSGVPGNVAGLTLALQKYGTMDLEQVIQPAIALASDGISVSQGLAQALTRGHDWLVKSPASKRTFFKADGSAYQVGDNFKQADLARSLTLIQKQGAKAFYQGDIAKHIVEIMRANGGLLSKKDLQAYQAEIVEPVSGNYRGYKVFSMPPPSSGGVTLIETLNILEGFPLQQQGLHSAKSLHEYIEAMNYAYNDRNHYLGDPDFVDMPVSRLTSKSYAKSLRKKINLLRHTPAANISKVSAGNKESRETTHFSVIDKEGNMVANTYTLNFSFGSGYTVPGTGILLNNEMADFAAIPGKADPYGLVTGENNAIAPGKRPLSSMTPTIVLKPNGEPLLATGSPGGSRIITTVMQLLINVIDFHLNIASATNMPRVHSQLWPDQVFYEQGLSPDTIRLLQSMGHQLSRINAMGSLQTVEQAGKKKLGAADPRRVGALAIGYE